LGRFRYALLGANPATLSTAWQVSLGGVFQVPKLSPIADSTTAMQFFKADGTTAVMTIDTTNSRVGIGTTAPSSTLDVTGNFKLTGSADIWFGSPTGAIKVGADVSANTRSSNTRKLASFTAPDYANTRNVEFFNFDSSSSLVNALNMGGRSGGSQYGATEVNFLTTASPSTTGGVVAMSIKSDSKIGIGTTAPTTKLDVNGGTKITGDLNITRNTYQDGNIFTNMIYGEDWNKADGGFETVDLVTQDVYVRATKLGAGSLNGFTVADGNLIATYGGMYQVTTTASVTRSGTGGEYGMKGFVNDTGQNNCYSHFHLAVTTPNANPSFTCFVRLAVGDKYNTRFDNHDVSVEDIILESMNTTIVRVGN
jgi:hypothetical protein